MNPAKFSPLRTGVLLVVLALLTALAPFSVDMYTPSLPRIQSDLGGADWEVQGSITACLLGIGIGQLFLGPLSDRWGRRPVVLVGTAGWMLASLASAFVPSVTLLVLARGLSGLLGSAGIVVARSVVRDISDSPKVVGGRIALLAMVSGVAPILAPTAGEAISAAWGWRGDFVSLALLGALLLPVAFVLVPETVSRESRRAGASIMGSIATALRDRELRNVALSLGLQAFGFFAYVATSSFIVEREFGYSPAAFALVFGTNAAAICAMNLLFRRLVRKWHPRFLLGIGLTATMLGGALLAAGATVHASASVLWGASIIFALGMGFVIPGAHSWGQLTKPASGAASALTGSAQFLGGVLGSPATGIVGPTALSLGLIMVASAVLALVAWRFAMRSHSAQG